MTSNQYKLCKLSAKTQVPECSLESARHDQVFACPPDDFDRASFEAENGRRSVIRDGRLRRPRPSGRRLLPAA
ncbi:unnamed protein product, partial [Mycena citricolor]